MKIGSAAKREPTFLGWTWRAHFDDLHRLVVEEEWLQVSKKLSAMLSHALHKATSKRGE